MRYSEGAQVVNKISGVLKDDHRPPLLAKYTSRRTSRSLLSYMPLIFVCFTAGERRDTGAPKVECTVPSTPNSLEPASN